jgi:hypothetical protein
MTARTSAPPGKRNGPGVGRPESVEQDEALAGGKVRVSTLPPPADDRPRCAVVGVYCEALWWLRREPPGRTALCCRGYWHDAEGWAS